MATYTVIHPSSGVTLNTSTGAITFANAVTISGAVTLGSTAAFTGAITPTGGIAAGGGFTASPRLWHVGGVSAVNATDGTDTTAGATTEVYVGEVFVDCNATLTGAAIFNGPTVGTDKYHIILYDDDGTVVAETAAAGTTTAGADAYQRIAFTSTYAAKGPATYYLGVALNGTTDNFHTFAVGNFGAGTITGQVFGTSANITVPTTFTAGDAPMASLY